MLVAYLDRRMDGLEAIFVSEVVRAFALIPIVIFTSSPLFLLCVTQFVISLLETVYHPNRYSFINQTFTEGKRKAGFIARLQTFDSIAGTVGPVLSGLMILAFAFQIRVILDIVTYVASAVYWYRRSRDQPATSRSETGLAAGYKALRNNRAVLNVNIARTLGSALAYGLAAGSMAAGIAAGGYGLSAYIRRSQSESLKPVIRLAALAVLTTGFATLPAIRHGGVELIGIMIAASLLGIVAAAARTACIMVGQQVTPASILHLVMAAGDSIMRIVSAAFALAMGLLVSLYGDSAPALFGILAAASASSIAGLAILAHVERRYLRDTSDH
ncbi:MAG: MFS transporter [Hyphomicrobiales bacterium]